MNFLAVAFPQIPQILHVDSTTRVDVWVIIAPEVSHVVVVLLNLVPIEIVLVGGDFEEILKGTVSSVGQIIIHTALLLM